MFKVTFLWNDGENGVLKIGEPNGVECYEVPKVVRHQAGWRGLQAA